MNHLLRFKVTLGLLLILAGESSGKCPPGNIYLALKLADGTISAVYGEATGYNDVEGFEEDYYSPVHLAAGDSVRLIIEHGPCGASNTLTKDGQWVNEISLGSWSNTTFMLGTSGDYYAMSCDEGCKGASFQLVSPQNLPGPIMLDVKLILDGAINNAGFEPPLMRTILAANDLLPLIEPYTQLGFVQVSGGGEVMNTSGPTHTIVDWIFVELRSSVDPTLVIATRSALLTKYGNAVGSSDFSPLVFDLPAGDYYIAVRHRNHLGAMTANPVSLPGPCRHVDLSRWDIDWYGENAEVAWGQHRLLTAGNSRITGGSQQVKYIGLNDDRDPILQRIGGTVPTTIVSGYYNEDLNLDGVVKYTGANNDRDVILQTIGGSMPTAVRVEQIP